ncbi:MAG: hypothetical protein K9L26_01395 [Candidatus Izimaplasma sp.]|nr:hypothetical protein [Candidatus Izimaplasma bacterium]
MQKNTHKYEYKQLEAFKATLELGHIKLKTLLVNLLTLVFAVILVIVTYQLKINPNYFYTFIGFFILFFVVNIAFYSYNEDHYNYLRIAMYFNTIALFSITAALIIVFQTPSVFTALFLAYAIIFIYQDYKVMVLSNILVFIFGALLVINFPNILDIPNNATPQVLLIIVFLFVFVVLLALSSYILIKRKMFFYNQLAQIKESEIRNIDMLEELHGIVDKEKMNVNQYYDDIEAFTEVLTDKLEIDNVFRRKIQLLRELDQKSLIEIRENYANFTIEEIKRLRLLELRVNHKMRNLAIKASQSKTIDVDKTEIFSESQFKSFNHIEDSLYVKIISFVVFYVLIKIDKPYLKEIPEETIKDVLLNSKYHYSINRNVLKIYLNNNAVFDTIVNDILKEGEKQ